MGQAESNEEVPVRCPHCGGAERQVRAGTNNGVQRYKCGTCQRRYTPAVDGQGHADAVREQAADLRARGTTIREIARQLGVSHQTVANWLRREQVGPSAGDPPAAPPPRPTGKPRPTIREVARQANVSTSCVSNFLNQKGRMAESTRQRIQAAMRELHFTPSALVRAIQRRRTNILGVMLQSLDSLNETEGPAAFLVPALLRGISDGADAVGNDLLLYTGGRRSDRDDLEVRFLGGHIDGLIWMTMGKHRHVLEQVVAAGLPVVALMTTDVPDGVSCITADNRGGMRRLVTHLAEQGHRRIAYVGPDWGTDFQSRHDGYRQAMSDLKLSWEPALQATIDRHIGTEECASLLASLLALPNPPTALLCGNDHFAAQFAEALRARGLGIPGDMALAGFDDMPIAEHVAGGLTTIRQPFRLMGKMAAEHLVALVNGIPAGDPRIVLPTEMVVRASTLRPK